MAGLTMYMDLTPTTTAEGGRQTPLLVTGPLRYRANWGLPSMTGTDQTGAPLLCSSAATLAPGDSARAVIIPLTDAHMTEWRLLEQGDGCDCSKAHGSAATPSSAGRKHQPPSSRHRHRSV